MDKHHTMCLCIVLIFSFIRFNDWQIISEFHTLHIGLATILCAISLTQISICFFSSFFFCFFLWAKAITKKPSVNQKAKREREKKTIIIYYDQMVCWNENVWRWRRGKRDRMKSSRSSIDKRIVTSHANWPDQTEPNNFL